MSSTVSGLIDLAITKTVDRPQGPVGSQATFTVVAANIGVSSASNVVVDDQLPDGLTVVAARPSSGTFDPTSRRWSIGDLSPGATATIEITVSLDVAGTHVNVVTIGQTSSAAANALTAVDNEVRMDNNTASATIEVAESASQLPPPPQPLPATGFGAWDFAQAAFALVFAATRVDLGVGEETIDVTTELHG